MQQFIHIVGLTRMPNLTYI